MEAGQLLGSLLERQPNGSLARQLSADLPRLLPSLHTTTLISVRHLRDVYHVRAMINERGCNLGQGFSELLPALDSFEGELILHLLKEQEEIRWIVFSDKTMTQFVGLLRLPTQAEIVDSLDELSE